MTAPPAPKPRVYKSASPRLLPDQVNDLRAEIESLRTRVAALEAAQPAPLMKRLRGEKAKPAA